MFQLNDRLKDLFPSLLGSGHDVSGNIGNVTVIETSTECRHGVLSVGDLVDDSLLVSATSQEGGKGFLLKSLVGHDHILSSGVAGGAVGIEDLLSVVNISGNSGLDGKSEGNSSSGGGLQIE